MTHPLYDEPWENVLDAARLCLTDTIAERGHVHSADVERRVMAQLGYTGPYHPGRTFQGRVTRAIQRLVTDGEIVRVGSPSRLYTPATYAQACVAAQEKRDEQAAREQRWETVRAKLHEAGFQHVSGGLGLLAATLDEWEGLTARLMALDVMRP